MTDEEYERVINALIADGQDPAAPLDEAEIDAVAADALSIFTDLRTASTPSSLDELLQLADWTSNPLPKLLRARPTTPHRPEASGKDQSHSHRDVRIKTLPKSANSPPSITLGYRYGWRGFRWVNRPAA
jgi:hypothetical protein